MNVVFTVEVVRVDFLVVDSLHLDSRRKQVVLASAQVCDSSQGLKGFAGLDVHCEGQFSYRERPQVHVVDVNNIRLVLFPNILLQLAAVDVFRRTLHHYVNTVLQSWVRGHQDHDGEGKGAEWVEPPQVWSEVDDSGGSDHSKRHQHVT